MRIAVFHNLPPGGARRALLDLVRSTRDSHVYDLYRLTLGKAERWPELTFSEELDTLVNRVHRYSLFHPSASARVGRAVNVEQTIRVQRRIAADIDDGTYDLVFVHHDQFTSSPAVLESLNTPSVYYCQEPRRRSFEVESRPAHQFGVLSGAAWAYERLLRRRDVAAARAADLMLCNSLFSAESIRRAYEIDAKVCYLGVDTERFSPSLARPAEEAPFILVVGAVDSVKNPGLVVEAAARLPIHMRPAVEIIGERLEPLYHARLVERAAILDVELRVVLRASDDNLVSRYRAAAATACVGRLEPFGLTALESMACGTPVVAIREGGYRETVLDGVNGLLTDPTPQSVASALATVLNDGVEFDAADLHGWVDRFWSLDAAGSRLNHLLEYFVAPPETEPSCATRRLAQEIIGDP